jgi:polyisoprenoid-binding protein YceI
MSLKKVVFGVSVLAFPLVLAGPATLVAAEKAATGAKSASKTLVYKVDPKASSLQWTGKKVTGQHHGTVPVKGGEVWVAGNALTGGKFEIDTANLDDVDLKDNKEYHDKLVGHLKSPDFFDVQKYPTSTFEITKVESLAATSAGADQPTHRVTGNLTIKNITKPLSFPATVKIDGGTLTATAKNVVVDRTQYDIRYGSGKFFQGLGDKVINDEFLLDINLVAKK